MFTKITEYDGITEYKLNSNDLKLLLAPRRAAPVVAFMVLYRVGSRNEAVGHTGSTHLLEHMLFKGTPTYNKRAGTQIAAVLQRQGALFNADTWNDRTRYFEMLPNDQLELAIHLEADRMRNSFIADEDRQSEMTVVRNELERGENEPSNILHERLWAMAFGRRRCGHVAVEGVLRHFLSPEQRHGDHRRRFRRSGGARSDEQTFRPDSAVARSDPADVYCRAAAGRRDSLHAPPRWATRFDQHRLAHSRSHASRHRRADR